MFAAEARVSFSPSRIVGSPPVRSCRSNCYIVFISVPKSCYADWKEFEDELYDQGWYDDMQFMRETRREWKYAVLFERAWNYRQDRYYSLKEVFDFTREPRLFDILVRGKETKTNWSLLKEFARTHGLSVPA